MKQQAIILILRLFPFIILHNALYAQSLPIPLALNNRWIYKFPNQDWPLDTVMVTAVRNDGNNKIWTITSSWGPDYEYTVHDDTIIYSLNGIIKKYFTIPNGQVRISWAESVYVSYDTIKTPSGDFNKSIVYEVIIYSGENEMHYSKENVVPGIGIVSSSENHCSWDCFGYEKILVSFTTSTSSNKNNNIKLYGYSLSQNYPNPFNPSTVISFQIPMASHVSLKIFDLLGREVAALVNEEKRAGSYEVTFDGKNLSSGVYFYRLQAGDPSTGSGQRFVQTKKLSLLR
jgi:hypothetical protein